MAVSIVMELNPCIMKRALLTLASILGGLALSAQTSSPVHISGREVLWDDFLTEECSAQKVMHSPWYKAPVVTLDKPWEGDGCGYFNILRDPQTSTWFMYYTALEMFRPDGSFSPTSDIHACVMTSSDGINWTRPELGIVEFEGSGANNIIVGIENMPGLTGVDNFYVMLDTNPSPAVPQRFKAVMRYDSIGPDGTRQRRLASLVSDDGLHFQLLGTVTDKGYFDTLNTVMWHEASGRYICFVRSFHQKGTFKEYEGKEKDGSLNSFVRDIRVLYSDDFLTWTQPQRLNFDSVRDYPLYTNGVSVYPYAPQMLVGFPTRYVEREEWSDNFDRLCGREKRLERMKYEQRFGLAVTDCLFMCSRDGRNWHRNDEAFLRPGPEYPTNWVYGSCYPCIGMTESPSEIPGGDNILNMFVYRNHWSGEPTVLERYAMRKDGFVSLHAGVEEAGLLTKPFVFAGDGMTLNLSTSAAGHVHVTLIREEDGLRARSCEIFGDSTDRPVSFDRPLSEFAGRSVRMLLELSDADVYAFEFTMSNPSGSSE